MSIGTGIFLGMMCLATVILYSVRLWLKPNEPSMAQTTGRWLWKLSHWRWQLFARWAARGVVALIVIFALIFGYGSLRQYLHSGPKPANSYVGISLGDSKEQVIYARGSPTHSVTRFKVSNPNDVRTSMSEIGTLPRDRKAIKDHDEWLYWPRDAASIGVKFSPSTHRVTSASCFSGPGKFCPELLGVASGTSEEEILRNLGEPSAVNIDRETFIKTISYSHLNVAFGLQKRTVTSLELTSNSGDSAAASKE